MKRLTVLVVVGLLLVVWISRFVPQTPDTRGYQDRTRLAVEQTLTEVSTSALVLERLERDALPGAYATVSLRTSVAALDSASGSYAELFPPPGSDGLAQETVALMGEAQDAVRISRLAVSRDDSTQYAALVAELHDLAGRLQQLDDELQAASEGASS